MAPDDPWSTAARAWTLAPATCPPRCRGYHRLWPTLRALGLGAGPDRHRDWFARHLPAGPADRDRPDRRILVCGLADPAMLATVLATTAGEASSVVVLDRCPTPVTLALEQAAVAAGPRRVAGVVAEALGHADPLGFDVITTHSFLSQVTAAERRRLVAGWRDLLRPAGRVVTNTRLAPRPHEQFEADRIAGLRGTVARALDTAPPHLLPAPRAELVDAVDAYAEAVTIHPLRTVQELRHLFEEAGLDVALRTVRPRSALPAGAGPGTAQDADYVELVATRAT